jgi:hypothetical protein
MNKLPSDFLAGLWFVHPPWPELREKQVFEATIKQPINQPND